ncbi:kinase [Raoultella ornithinolytica]|nr:kinase [Raoultella ornithinolytica]
MTIRIFPSRLPGEPLERHEHGTLTFHDWMLKNVKDYAEATKHPIVVELNGKPLPPNEWPLCLLKPESDIKMFPVPYGTGLEIAAWAAIAVAVASAAYSIYMMSTMDKSGGYSSTNGLGLDLNPAKANTAKLGDPIRELFGRYRIYPDYVVQPGNSL